MLTNKTLRGDVRWALRRVARKTINRLLPLRAHWKLALIRGRIVRRTAGEIEGVREDLAIALLDKTQRELDKITSQNAEFRYRLDPLKDVLPLISKPAARKHWRIEGREHLDAALKSGRGAVLLTGHLGYSKLITPILRSHGYDAVGVVAKSLRTMEREARLESWGSHGNPLKEGFRKFVLSEEYDEHCIGAQLDVRPIFSALEANKLVMIAGDGLKSAEFVELPLLGLPYPFAKGFMRIAMISRTVVLPTFALEGAPDHWILVKVNEPLPIDPDSSVERNLVLYSRALESQIRSTPHLWYRWGAREGLATAYRDGGATGDRWNRGLGALAKNQSQRHKPGTGSQRG